MAIITIIYAVFSFINLGSFSNPQTFWKSEYYNDTVILELEKESKISYIRYFTGNTTDKYYISFSNDKINYSDISYGVFTRPFPVKLRLAFKFITGRIASKLFTPVYLFSSIIALPRLPSL